MKLLTITLFLCAFSINAFAQTEINKPIRFEQVDQIIYTEKGSGSFVLIAGVQTQSSGFKSSFICLMDTSGTQLWKKNFIKSNFDLIFSKVITNPQGQLVAVGCQRNLSQQVSKPYVAVLNNSGETIWENCYGESEYDRISDVYIDPQNDMYVCGTAKVRGEGNSDILVAKISAKGKKIWESNVGNKYVNDKGMQIFGKDNFLFVVGTTFSNTLGQNIAVAAKLDNRGTLVTFKNYENIFADSCFIKPSYTPGNLAAFVYRKNSDGSYENRQFDILENSLEAKNIIELYNGNAMLCDNSKSAYLFKNNVGKTFKTALLIKEGDEKTWYSVKTKDQVFANHLLEYNNKEIYIWQYNNNNEEASALYLTKFSKNTGYKNTAIFIKENFDNMAMAANEQQDDELTRGGNDPFKGMNVAKAADLKPGTYYALIIGIDNYNGKWTKLQNAVNDAKGVEQCLSAYYKFDKIQTIYNENATRSAILTQLDHLAEIVKENDNVLIFYSGHGELKKELNKGFWVPVDAKTSNSSDLISNLDIQSYLSAFKSKHTLLITDACFSGEIFRGSTSEIKFDNTEKYYKEVYRKASRNAITSGGIEPVSDGGKENHSVFTYYLLKTLKSNPKKYFDSAELFNEIKVPVSNNSNQTPQFQSIKNAGDEGGQFIFIKK